MLKTSLQANFKFQNFKKLENSNPYTLTTKVGFSMFTCLVLVQEKN